MKFVVWTFVWRKSKLRHHDVIIRVIFMKFFIYLQRANENVTPPRFCGGVKRCGLYLPCTAALTREKTVGIQRKKCIELKLYTMTIFLPYWLVSLKDVEHS